MALKKGDIVKVIKPTTYLEEKRELIPIGTICRIIEVLYEKNGVTYYELEQIYPTSNYTFCYLKDEIEKGYLRWIKADG